MKLAKLFTSKKYLLQIYFAITISAAILVTSVIWSIYYVIRGNVLELETESSFEVLTQMKNNIEFMSETSKNACFSIFLNNNVQSLLYHKGEPLPALMDWINKVTDSYLASDPVIHSVYIYNAACDEYYSTYNGIYNIDAGFKQLLSQGKLNKNLIPTIRMVGEEAVATFEINTVSKETGLSDGAVFVNIRFDWLVNYMDTVNRMGDITNGSQFIFDEKYRCINGDIDPTTNEISGVIAQSMKSLPEKQTIEMFSVDIQGEKYTATMLEIPAYNWKVVRIYPYELLFMGINKIKLAMLLLNAIAIVIVMGLFILLARRIYQPVNRLMKNINISDAVGGNQTEFERLEQCFLVSKEELRNLETEKAMQGEVYREYALKQLFSAGKALSQAQINKLKEDYHVLLRLDLPLSVTLIRIDDFSLLHKDYDQKSDRPLVLFGMINILSEIFSVKYENECVSIDENHIAILYNTQAEGEPPLELVKKAEKLINQLFSLSFCVSWMDGIDLSILPGSCESLAISLEDRFMLGENCIITEEVRSRTRQQLFSDYRFEDEGSFLNYLSEMKLEAAQKSLDKLIAKLQALDYQSACIATTHLTNSIQQVIFEVNKHRKEPIAVKQYKEKWEQTPAITLQQYQQIINEFLGNLQNQYTHGSSKHQIMAETIKDYIDKMYDTYDLSAVSIADMLKISSAHAGRVFNQHMNMSIPEYINCIRLKRAMEWMQNSDFTIQEIMSKVGYQNESYFYKVFKEKFEMTPRAYVKSLNRSKTS